MKVRTPVTVSSIGGTTGKAIIDLKMNGMVYDQDFFDKTGTNRKVHSGSTEGSKVYIPGTYGVNAAVRVDIKSKASFKICFAWGMCTGIAAEAMIDAAAGANAAITSAYADSKLRCNKWTMDTAHTKYCKYTAKHKQSYEDAKVAAGGGLIVAGGAWSYVTHPYFRVYPVGLIGSSKKSCLSDVSNIFEYKPVRSLRDDLSSSQTYEHPYGKYLLRTAAVFTKTLSVTKLLDGVSGGTIPISIKPYTYPRGWNGILPDIAASYGRRNLLAAPVGATGVGCTEFNGGSASRFKGSVPAARVSCGGDNRRLDVDGDAKPLCWSRSCCNGYAVQLSWARFVCVPTDVVKDIAPGNTLP